MKRDAEFLRRANVPAAIGLGFGTFAGLALWMIVLLTFKWTLNTEAVLQIEPPPIPDWPTCWDAPPAPSEPVLPDSI